MALKRSRLDPRAALVAAVVTPLWFLLFGYVAFSAQALATSGVTGWSLGLNGALLAIEGAFGAFGLFMLGALAAPRPPVPAALPAGPDAPLVSLYVPVFGEAVETLAATLAGANALDWPKDRLQVFVVDDTPDRRHAGALKQAAEAAGARYVTRAERRGYKAGALNDALQADNAEFVALLDVDHIPVADWLRRVVPVIARDEGLAYVQARMVARNTDSTFRRAAGLLDTHFAEIIQSAKAPRGIAAFTGSAAVFRRAAILDVGGFPEDTLVEDYDFTVKALIGGWRTTYVPVVAARGLVPYSVADTARQLWRWAHGGTRVVVLRLPDIFKKSARSVPLRVRFECVTDGVAYAALSLFIAAAGLLVAAGLGQVPLVRAAGVSPFWFPGLLLFAHVLTAVIALHRSGERRYFAAVPYHLLSIAFTPVVWVAVCAAFLRVGQRLEGRIAKEPGAVQAPSAGMVAAGVAIAGFGATLVVAAVALFVAGNGAWMWSGQLGVAFFVPLVTGVREWRGRAPPAAL